MAYKVWTGVQNRKEGNDQESIQLSQTSHQRHQRERNTNTKYLDPNGNITSRKPNGQLLSQAQIPAVKSFLQGQIWWLSVQCWLENAEASSQWTGVRGTNLQRPEVREPRQSYQNMRNTGYKQTQDQSYADAVNGNRDKTTGLHILEHKPITATGKEKF